MIYLCIAAIGLTILGLERVIKTFWAFADALHEIYVRVKNN